jgi:lysophospholipase L1-like esterase
MGHALAIGGLALAAVADNTRLTEPWGTLILSNNGNGAGEATVTTPPADGKILLPPNLAPLTKVSRTDLPTATNLTWRVDSANGAQWVDLEPSTATGAHLHLERLLQNGQLTEGRILFLPKTAKLDHFGTSPTGTNIDEISGWTEAGASATWEFKPTRWGKYDVELTYSGNPGEGTELSIDVAGTNLKVTPPAITGAGHVGTFTAGRFYLTNSEPFTVHISSPKAARNSTFSLKAVSLQPAPEGAEIRQTDAAEILLPASQGITHSVMMRYEPATNKNCMGYWVNPSDWAEWSFTVTSPGIYGIDVFQGCGSGNGGSTVAVWATGRKMEFVVEDTGHFQNFKYRRVGQVLFPKAGRYTLEVRPERKSAAAVMDIRQVRLAAVKPIKDMPELLQPVVQAKRVAFLGDSITYAGEWVEFTEGYLRQAYPETDAEVINLGLPSETVSGLSEEGHAGGAFPRPGLHERLGRVLDRVHPDVIYICYGMNDGIYLPLSPERFGAFKDGITRFRSLALAKGIQVVHLTPSPFDPVPLKGRTSANGVGSPFEGYDGVLAEYSNWLISQRTNGWKVIDLHGPFLKFVADQRTKDAGFTLAGDGVHPNSQGHWLMAREVLRAWGAPEEVLSAETAAGYFEKSPHGNDILKVVQKRQRLLKDAWLTYSGHQRPGMNRGKPVPEAEVEAVQLTRELQMLTAAPNH